MRRNLCFLLAGFGVLLAAADCPAQFRKISRPPIINGPGPTVIPPGSFAFRTVPYVQQPLAWQQIYAQQTQQAWQAQQFWLAQQEMLLRQAMLNQALYYQQNGYGVPYGYPGFPTPYWP